MYSRSFHIHKSYRNVLSGDDIALIRIDQGMEFNEKVGPVCLPSVPKRAREDLVIIGFGHTKLGKGSKELKKVSMPGEVCSSPAN